jgi:acyl-CoA synthetase (AMP-forming)/AMP-acid ligase II
MPLRSPFEALAAQVRSRPDATFLSAPASAELPYAPDGFALAYGAFGDSAASLAAAYADAGYGAGMRVGLLLENRPEFFRHWMALNALGISIVPINPDLKPDEIAFQLGLAKPELVVALPERRDQVARSGYPAERIASPDESPPAAAAPHGPAPAGLETECALLFTSGTSGAPKGCILSNRYFLTLADWYVNQGGTATLADGAETVLTPLPLFHMNALACSALGMILKGGTLVPIDRFHASRWWRTVADSGATAIHYLGVMPAILLRREPEPAEHAHRVRFGFGAGVDADEKRRFEARFAIPLVEAWAMTETGAGAVTTTARETGPLAPRCIGRPTPTTAWRVVNDAGEDAPAGVPGELLVRAAGPDPRAGFFSGYLDDPEATDKAWEGGWFHTGDVVTHDSAGLLFFFDRKKNVIRRSGENIAVLEVEAVLAALPDVAAVAVAPAPDDIRGEEVFALVVAQPSAAPDAATAEQIVRAASERLSYHKLPGYIAFVEAIPVTATQKLRRGEIRTEAERLRRSGAAIDLRALKTTLRHG